MRRNRFTEEHMVAVLHEAGSNVGTRLVRAIRYQSP